MAQDPLDWIMGLNPFDACMIEGYGKNNIQYFFKKRYDFLNCPGGIGSSRCVASLTPLASLEIR